MYQVHLNQRPEKCEMCNYACWQKSVLRRHVEKVHEAIAEPKKRPSCELCGKSFRIKSKLQRHEQIHNKVHGNINLNFVIRHLVFKMT